ncbi:hypothetical protein ACFL7D_06495 [candidate division KSB1 bacterium]
MRKNLIKEFSTVISIILLILIFSEKVSAHQGVQFGQRGNQSVRLTEFPVDILRFAGEGGKNSIEVFYGLPLSLPMWERDIIKFTSRPKSKVSVYDKDRNLVFEEDITTKILIYLFEMEHIYNDVYTISQRMELDPGEYEVVVFLFDEASGNQAILSDKLVIEDRGLENLSMSDIMLAYNITLKDIEAGLSRDNVKLFHHPAHLYHIDKPIYIFFEIYNLYVADESGSSNYVIEYSVSPVKYGKVDDIDMKHFISNMDISEFKTIDEVRTQTEYNIKGRTDYQFFQIDHHIIRTGQYIVSVNIHDKTSGQELTKSTPIWIFENK